MRAIYLIIILSTVPLMAKEISIKNYRELYESLKVSLNLAPTPDSALKKTFDSVMEVLPPSGNAKEYNASMQWSLIKLTSEFCKERIVKDSKLAVSDRWVHKKIDFTVSPKAQTSVASTLGEYSEIFWQRGMKAEEEKLLSAFSLTLLTELPDTKKSLIPYLTSLCTIVGTTSQAVAFF